MAKKLTVKSKISTNKVPSTPVPKSRKMKVTPFKGADTGALSKKGFGSANTGAQGSALLSARTIGEGMSQELDFEEQQQRGKANAYSTDLGYFDVPVDDEGRYTDSGANVAKKLRMKKGKK